MMWLVGKISKPCCTCAQVTPLSFFETNQKAIAMITNTAVILPDSPNLPTIVRP